LDESGNEVAHCVIAPFGSGGADPGRESGGQPDVSAATACQPRVVR
jgi:hypothetical protein